MTNIEIQASAKALLKSSQKLVAENNPWSVELQKASETLIVSASISVQAYQFALRVLEATIQDARS